MCVCDWYDSYESVSFKARTSTTLLLILYRIKIILLSYLDFSSINSQCTRSDKLILEIQVWKQCSRSCSRNQIRPSVFSLQQYKIYGFFAIDDLFSSFLLIENLSKKVNIQYSLTFLYSKTFAINIDQLPEEKPPFCTCKLHVKNDATI